MTNPTLSYIICTGPRTGSSLLCGALWRTGVAGHPAEYFDVHARNEAHWQKELDVRDDRDYVDKVLGAGTTANGVFGLKLHWHQSPALMTKLLAARPGCAPAEPSASGDLDRLLRARLGEVRYIWLRRKNKVAQAISYYRAAKSDLWRVPAGAPRAAEGAAPVAFDYNAIDTYVQSVKRFDRNWHEFFVRQKLRALVVLYEDFIRTREKTVHGVLGYLGLDDPALVISPPQYRRQADDTSVMWERQYREMLAAKNAPPRYTPTRPARVGRASTRAAVPAAKQASPAEKGAAGELPLIAYDIGSGINHALEPAPPGRAWMDATPKRFAYRCLPLLIANQAGWFIRNTHRLTVIWDGTDAAEGLRISRDADGSPPYASSHFGSGVLTFNLGFLFRTPPGYNLYVRGPANWPKDGIYALEGIVETDWSRASFTVNWKLTRPGHPVTFEAGEPIAMISPLLRGDIERFRPEIQPIAAEPEWQADYRAWANLRLSFNTALKAGAPEAVKAGWQRHYLRGVTVGDTEAPEHQTALSLAPFPNWPPAKP